MGAISQLNQQELKDYIKCLKFPSFYLNNFGYVYSIEKEKIDKLTCFPYQNDCIEKYHKNKNNIVLKSRQLGFSVITAGYVAWRLIFHANERILIVANDGASTVRFLGVVRQFLDYTPKFLLPDTRITDNTKQVILSNGSWAKAVASSPNAGRGESSLTLLVLDETAFIEHADDIWVAAGLAISAPNSKCIMISCVTKDTFIFTDRGIKQINDFVDDTKNGGYNVKSYNILGKDKLRNGNLFFNNGFGKTLKIHTTNSKLEGSLEHKLWAYKNNEYRWFKLKELNEGDQISIQYGNNIWGENDDVSDFKPSENNKIINKFNPKKIDKNIAYLLGLFISEGYARKTIKRNKFIGGQVIITCGDDVSSAIKNVGLNFCKTKNDNWHYSINSKNFIEFLEYLGFDINLKAKQKIIPNRLLEMSKENIKYLLRGIFDGDGYSRKDRGTVGIGLSSKKLIEQIRMILLNFGILTDYQEILMSPTKKVKVYSQSYRISLNYNDSFKFYNEIGFGFNRKQDKLSFLNTINLKWSTDDIVPNSIAYAKKIIKDSGRSKSAFKKLGFNTKNIITVSRGQKDLSRYKFLHLIELCKNTISKEDLEFYNKIASINLKWNKINKIDELENHTYDFSLPETEGDFWCHSVIYNGIIGHQTPNGTNGLYYRTWVAAKKGENDFVRSVVHLSEHPLFSKGLEERIDEFGKKYRWSKWYEEQCAKYQYNSVKISQELDLSFEGSQSLVVPIHVLERYEKDCIGVKPKCYYDYTEMDIEKRFVTDRETTFQVWERPLEGRNYIVSADIARGDGDDYSTVQVIDADNLVQVAEYQGKIQPDIFAQLIYNIATDYNKAFVAAECNSFGLATCLVLKNQLKYNSDKLYHSKSAVKLYNRTNNLFVDQDDVIPGFQTTTKSRPLVISAIVKYMRDGQIKINSSKLIDEFKTFIYHGDKAEHAKGFHDDLIFAFGIGLLIRDTELSGVFWNKESVKSLLGAISSVKGKMDGHSLNDVSKNKQDKTIDNLDDLSWLYGSITRG